MHNHAQVQAKTSLYLYVSQCSFYSICLLPSTDDLVFPFLRMTLIALQFTVEIFFKIMVDPRICRLSAIFSLGIARRLEAMYRSKISPA